MKFRANFFVLKPKKIYKITIEDESKLEKIVSHSYSPATLAGIISVACLALILFGGAIVAFTPVHNLIPGYFRDSQRAVTEEAFMRIDSLQDAYKKNEAYIANIISVLDVNREPKDSILMAGQSLAPSADSLLARSPEEARFAATMQEREKFNISVLASIASEGMLLYPVSNDGVISEASKNKFDAEIIMPDRSPVMAMADGVVIDAFYDSNRKSNTVLMQHDNGFVSRLSGLGTLLVSKSDIIPGGGIIADSKPRKAQSPSPVTLSLWHNGTPVKPYGFIRGNNYLPKKPSIPHRKSGRDKKLISDNDSSSVLRTHDEIEQ